MRITNKLGLPESFVQMAKSDFTADENTYRVTSLLKGVGKQYLSAGMKQKWMYQT